MGTMNVGNGRCQESWPRGSNTNTKFEESESLQRMLIPLDHSKVATLSCRPGEDVILFPNQRRNPSSVTAVSISTLKPCARFKMPRGPAALQAFQIPMHAIINLEIAQRALSCTAPRLEDSYLCAVQSTSSVISTLASEKVIDKIMLYMTWCSVISPMLGGM